MWRTWQLFGVNMPRWNSDMSKFVTMFDWNIGTSSLYCFYNCSIKMDRDVGMALTEKNTLQEFAKKKKKPA